MPIKAFDWIVFIGTPSARDIRSIISNPTYQTKSGYKWVSWYKTKFTRWGTTGCQQNYIMPSATVFTSRVTQPNNQPRSVLHSKSVLIIRRWSIYENPNTNWANSTKAGMPKLKASRTWCAWISGKNCIQHLPAYKNTGLPTPSY